MTKKRLVSTVIILGLVAVLSLLSLAQPVAPKGIIPMPPESQELEVRIWVDKGAYTVGDPISIHYSVNKQVYVYIWDITPDGKANQIFPNRYSQNNYVAAGEHTVPGSFTIVPPLGTEYLQILATTTPVNPFSFMTGDPEAFRLEIEVKILGIIPVSERSWNFTSFEIVSGTVPSYGALIINSVPSGAWITVDGYYTGYTPRTLYITQGYHQISLSKTGYQDWNRGLFVIGGQTRTINATLTPIAQVNQPPIAAFNFSPTNPLVGGWVQFNGSASSDPDGTITSYAWNFGDGGTGSGVTRYHQFAAPGTYTVTLTVTDDDGATDTEIHTIQVGSINQPPVAAFNFSPTNPLVGSWVQFNGSSSSDPDGTITSYAWNFGDGGTGSGVTRYHQFAAPGTYTVTLTVTDDDGATDTEIHTIQVASINQPPVAAFNFSPTNPLVGGWVQFNGSASSDPDGTITSYAWNFGDGGTGSGVTRYHQFTAPGTYTVTLTVTDDDGATDTEIHTLQVGSINQPPVAAFNFSPTNPLVGGWVQFNGSASSDPDGTITSYAWNFGDGGTGSGVTRYHQFAAPGTYTVTLTVTDDDGATDTEIHTIQVGSINQPPVAAFNFSPTNPLVGSWVQFNGSASSDPDGTITSYAWNFGDGGTGSGVTRYHQFTAPGTYTVTLTVTDDDGATDTEIHTVQVGSINQPPVAAFTYAPLSPGVGDTIVLNATSSYDPDGVIVSYSWDRDADGITDITGPIVSFSYYNVGPHTVRLTVVDNDGLSGTTVQMINVAGGGVPGEPPMGGTPGIFVWGTNTWHVTVNAGAHWTSAHSYRLEFRTDKSFSGVNQATSGGVVPLGVIPTPTDGGKTLVFEGSLQNGSVDYTFTAPESGSIWMSLKLDIDGNGTLDESPSFVYLRAFMVHPPQVPFVVGLQKGDSGPLVPSINFRIGTALTYTTSVRFIMWSTDIATLEGY